MLTCATSYTMYLEEQWLRKDNREYTDNMTDSENRDHFIRHER